MGDKKRRHLYLVSDATGETVHSIARACSVQFQEVEVIEHTWPMVRSERALDTVLEELEEEPGLVLYTLLDEALSQKLTDFCWQRQIPCISVLDPFINLMANFFGEESRGLPGIQHVMDAEYFSRIDAINFVLAHDDGQRVDNIEEADVILVGVSRTSKTPTSIYLANRGIKAANVPLVPNAPLPDTLLNVGDRLVVGLTEDPRRLVEIRRNRLRLEHEDSDTEYTDLDSVKEEVAWARRLFGKKGWPVIDVTRRSIEETAAAVMQLLNQRRKEEEEQDAEEGANG